MVVLIIIATAFLFVACGSPLNEVQRKTISEKVRDIAVYNKSLEEFNSILEDLDAYILTSPELVKLSTYQPECYMRSLGRLVDRIEESVDMMNYVMKTKEHPAQFLHNLCDSIENTSWINSNLCNNDEISEKLGMLAGTVIFRGADYTTGIYNYKSLKDNILNVLKKEIYHDYNEQPGYLASYYLPVFFVSQNMKKQDNVRVVYIGWTEGGTDNSYIVGYSNESAYCITFHSSESSDFNIEEVEFDSSQVDYDQVKTFGL